MIKEAEELLEEAVLKLNELHWFDVRAYGMLFSAVLFYDLNNPNEYQEKFIKEYIDILKNAIHHN